MRKIGTDQFYKPVNTSTTAASQNLNVSGKANKFDRYQSPALKSSSSNQAGITAKQSSGVPITTSQN